MPKVIKLGIAKNNNQKIQEVEKIELLSGKGVIEDRHFQESNDARTQITLIESENIDYFNKKFNVQIPYVDFRRNIITQGIELNKFIGKKLMIGETKIEGKNLCRPCKHLQELLNHEEITLETRANKSEKLNNGRATLTSVPAQSFIKNPKLSQEIFGPYSLIVKCEDQSELDQVLGSLDGQLTGSIIGDNSELSLYDSSIKIMERKVGRLIFNGVPTGVEVCPSMQHGGPFPASSDARFSSVGTTAIKRFVRPITYQSWPNDKLPDELKDENPLNIWRYVNGEWSKD